jgi:cell wall-associated NlpC family hydrolase
LPQSLSSSRHCQACERIETALLSQHERKKARLRPGDLVFFDENKNGKLQPWDHVGIYSGHGNLIHASSYFGKVVESKMKYIHGYWGAKRLTKLRS